jgi:CRISPR-associated endonuclease/helicase Cas3
LLHGQAHWSDKMQAIELRAIGEDEMGDHGRIAAMAWFKPRKRTLLAPFGVGTVDQTLLSVLQTRHFFVRLFGLSHKVIIFDEVHAYDTYMNTLFQRLLAWLRCIGASVILLSATLPAKTRGELIEAYVGNRASLDGVAYPALTMASAGDTKPRTIPLPPPDSYTLHLDSILSQTPEAIVDYLRNKLAKGGCAAVICNTVKRAQTVYRAIKDAEIVPADELILFHARFPPIWRQAIEDKVLAKFGKPEKDKPDQRPHKAIVVATQVIEQSLDLDFDLMITDSAPVDLLLQRAGRLHRHLRKNRPAHLPRCLTITQPEIEDSIPKFGPDAYVYDEYILLRSYFALRAHMDDGLCIPDDTRALIEKVYGSLDQMDELTTDERKALINAERKIKQSQRKAQIKANQRLVRRPDYEDLLGDRSLGLEEDNPDVHQTLQAFTRLIPPSISLACLHQGETGIFLEPDLTGETIDLDRTPNRQTSKILAQYTITLTRQDVVKHFQEQTPPVAWRKEATLCHYRCVLFHNGQYKLPGTPITLRLTHEFGLEILEEVT